MKKERILLLIATWIAILPYLGFPGTWKNILFTLTGLGLGYISYQMYSERKLKQKETSEVKKFDNFSENSEFNKI